MRVLVTGSQGLLGFDVVKRLESEKHFLFTPTHADLDITDKDSVMEYVKKIKPEVIIHCAAYTAVDKAEDCKEQCYDVNVNGTKNIVEACNSINCALCYISSDYVFAGQGDIPWSIYNETLPINYYGRTKLLGEKIIAENLTKYFIIRTSWVFGCNGKNFVNTMLQLEDVVNVVDDQVGSPTYTYDLATLISEVTMTKKYGIYHGTNEGYCSWYDFACEIFRMVGKNVNVNPIKSCDYNTAAKRPQNSRLDKSSLDNSGFNRLPTWEDALERYINQLNMTK